MKRYRIINIDFDTRATILKLEIKDEWDDEVKDNWIQNKRQIKSGLLKCFGEENSEIRLQNFIDIDAKPISILSFHNKFFEQVRTAFVMGAYYPALTGCCSLGERILNHLIILFRYDFRSEPEYKKVYRKKSFDNWDLPIDTLSSWGILLLEVVNLFRELKEKRNNAIHFRPDVDKNDRELALEAIRCLEDIIAKQFSASGSQPWFLTEVLGESYIKKDWETNIYIQKIYLPNCHLVGPFHKVESVIPRFKIIDDSTYQTDDITDDEFVELRISNRNN